MPLRCLMRWQAYMQDVFTEMLYLYGCAHTESNPWMEVCSSHYEFDYDCTDACVCIYVCIHVCKYVCAYVCMQVCMYALSKLSLGSSRTSRPFVFFFWFVLWVSGHRWSQPTLMPAPLAAQLARHTCNGEVVFRKLFSFSSVLYRSTQ